MQLKGSTAKFRVSGEQPLKLKKTPTSISPFFSSTPEYKDLLGQFRSEIKHWQSILYAEQRQSLLLIFQGMDTAGKGGAIRHVMSGVNPQGCRVHSFGRPSEEELAHDYLWRCVLRLPQRGMIGIFDRSYYEEVLVVRVKPEVLATQRLPANLINEKKLWTERFADISQFESYLSRNGTRVVKFFLHVSPEEQRKRLLARIDDPEKNWKFRMGDLDCRSHWSDFEQAYQDCLQQTSTKLAPWYVIPADDKRNARLLVSKIIVDTLSDMNPQYPVASPAHMQDLAEAKRLLSENL